MHRIIDIVEDAPLGSDSLLLDHDLRSRRRMVFTTVAGEAILLDLQRPAYLRDGQGLALDDGRILRVEAAPEALVEITAPDLPALVRIAWHLGNRHLPTQLLGDRLRIRDDHVMAEMAKGLGGICESVSAPFDPEGGAYAAPGHAHHDHDHDPHHHHHHHHDHD